MRDEAGGVVLERIPSTPAGRTAAHASDPKPHFVRPANDRRCDGTIATWWLDRLVPPLLDEACTHAQLAHRRARAIRRHRLMLVHRSAASSGIARQPYRAPHALRLVASASAAQQSGPSPLVSNTDPLSMPLAGFRRPLVTAFQSTICFRGPITFIPMSHCLALFQHLL